MLKRYANFAFLYAIVAMVFGVFYREFTKIIGFWGETRLSVMHTHYFVLGMVFLLVLLGLEKAFGFSGQKPAKWFWLLYNIGLNITGLALFVRGLLQAMETPVSSALDASLSGVAGIGHVLLGLGIILFFVALRKTLKKTT